MKLFSSISFFLSIKIRKSLQRTYARLMYKCFIYESKYYLFQLSVEGNADTTREGLFF